MSSLATAPVNAYQIVPWAQLTRYGIPQFTVCRRAISIKDVTYAIGDVLPPQVLPHPTRLRQLYQQRAITPVLETVGVTRAHPLKRLFGGRDIKQVKPEVAPVTLVAQVELTNDEFANVEFTIPQVDAEPVEEVEEIENFAGVLPVGSTEYTDADAGASTKSLSRKERRNRR